MQLPIDKLLPDIGAAVREHQSLVIEAAPGAGKTTRVPRALLDACTSEILVSEPRRLPAGCSLDGRTRVHAHAALAADVAGHHVQ